MTLTFSPAATTGNNRQKLGNCRASDGEGGSGNILPPPLRGGGKLLHAQHSPLRCRPTLGDFAAPCSTSRDWRLATPAEIEEAKAAGTSRHQATKETCP